MKLPAIFKPKAPALPVSEWVDQDAVQKLQDDAKAALKINEPLKRLIALRNVAAEINDALKPHDLKPRDISKGGYPPLTDSGATAFRQHARRYNKISGWMPLTLTLGTMGVLYTGLLAAAVFGMPVLVVAGIGAAYVSFFKGLQVMRNLEPAYRHALSALDEAAATLHAVRNDVLEAVDNIETTLTLNDARQSEFLDAALKISPPLKERFADEAMRAAIRHQPPAPEGPVIPPKRPNGAL